MRVRPRTAADLARIAALFTASVHGLVDHYSAEQIAAWAPEPPDLALWQARLQLLSTVVAEADAGALAGFLSWHPAGHIDLLFVSPQHARRGVASRLYETAESALTCSGITQISTHASLTARPFFAHQGFVVQQTQTVHRNGVALRRLAMVKALPRS